MTRKDLAAVINKKMGFSKLSADTLINTVFSAMKETLMSGESIKLVHFGTLGVRKKSPRRGRNPRTGDTMTITKRKTVSFKPSKGLRERINSK
ncbi:MAG: integration host factor subunit alpha [Deltaproteobacteria bacterium RIFOXYD12_FULL_57_12]|nr:MAG: integration host factor subunit alpha [Deltaproteobacteria bacterium RIFOXYD12_FULL_57_12]